MGYRELHQSKISGYRHSYIAHMGYGDPVSGCPNCVKISNLIPLHADDEQEGASRSRQSTKTSLRQDMCGIFGVRSMNKPALSHVSASPPPAGQRKKKKS